MPPTALVFRSTELIKRLRAFPAARRYLVGFSGGADSTALLHALYKQRGALNSNLEACHFNHGLNTEADAWQRHCENFCAQRKIPLHCHSLNLNIEQPNLENAAREARYQWVSSIIDEETVYLTAHHADDQAETFLLNALRGSGLDGASGIPEIRELGSGHVFRPLLGYPRSMLVDYLTRHDINWIEDPSNQGSVPDRNFIRNQVIPLIETRWPAARHALSRTAAHLRSANHVLKKLLVNEISLQSYDGYRLPLQSLNALGPSASGLILREWLGMNNTAAVPESRLNEFLDQISSATSESSCELAWAEWSLRLYRNELHLSNTGAFPPCPSLNWNQNFSLSLGKGLGKVQFDGSKKVLPENWSVGPRRAGVRIRLHAEGPARKLKKVLQEQSIPPWQRNSIPILYAGNEVLAIGDWQLSPGFIQWLKKNEQKYQWQPERRELCLTQDRCRERTLKERRA